MRKDKSKLENLWRIQSCQITRAGQATCTMERGNIVLSNKQEFNLGNARACLGLEPPMLRPLKKFETLGQQSPSQVELVDLIPSNT